MNQKRQAKAPTCCRFYACVRVCVCVCIFIGLLSACCACIFVSACRVCVCLCVSLPIALTHVTLSRQKIPTPPAGGRAQCAAAHIIARKAQFAWNCSDWPLRFCVPTFAVCQQLFFLHISIVSNSFTFFYACK